MREEFLHLPLVRNDENSRFELEVDGHTAFIEFKQRDEKITLIHTESPPELEGRGAATALVEKTLNYIESNGYKMVPFCPFVLSYLKRHPEWNRLRADNKGT